MISSLITLSFFTIGIFAASNTANFVIFGDSFSDVGNFQRWTNGPIWSEHVATGWNSTLHSFAYTGALCRNPQTTTDTAISYNSPSIEDQMEFYYQQQLNLDPTETVFAFWFGTNDIHQLFKENAVAPDFSSITECIMDQINIAHKIFKANQIMVINLPPMEYMPYFNKDPTLVASRKEAVNWVNQDLKKKVADFNKRYDGLKLDLFDIHSLLSNMVHDPSTFGLINTNRAYWDDCQGNCKKLKLEDYLWWDQTHMTGVIHHSIGNNILQTGHLAPSTSVTEIKVERLLMTTISNIRSPIYRAEPNTGLLQQMMTKTDTSTAYHQDDTLTTNTTHTVNNDISNKKDQLYSNGWWSSVLVIIFIFMSIAVLVWWKKQRKNNDDQHHHHHLLNNEDIP